MKTFQEFQEAVSKSDKLTGRLKMLYNLPSDKKEYFKQQNPLKIDRLKKAQIAPIPFSSPIKGIMGVDTRSEKQRARDRGLTVKGQTDFYDTEWGRMQGGPPKGP